MVLNINYLQSHDTFVLLYQEVVQFQKQNLHLPYKEVEILHIQHLYFYQESKKGGLFFSKEELRTAKMHKPFSFTKDIPVMQIKSDENLKRYVETKSALYDLIKDPGQLNSIKDNDLIDKYKELMIKVIKENDPPKELLFNYFGI